MRVQRVIRNGVQPEQVRAKIRGAYLIRRLQQHVAGKVTLTMAQVRAIDILLRKIIPDLNQTSVSGEMTHKHVAERRGKPQKYGGGGPAITNKRRVAKKVQNDRPRAAKAAATAAATAAAERRRADAAAAASHQAVGHS